MGNSNGEGLGGGGIVIGISGLRYRDRCRAYALWFKVDTIDINYCGVGTGISQGQSGRSGGACLDRF